ncbi:MAG: PKD domain-containing protein [Candidatus Eisenbacteria bacterium]|nr:PKD domain-containing protein [Candidatus Eisenbacteria bacterium]
MRASLAPLVAGLLALALAGPAFSAPERAAAGNLPAKLLIQAVCVSPSAGEYIAIYNPNDFAVDLSNYYYTDAIYLGTSPPQNLYPYMATGSFYTPAGTPARIPGGGAFFDFHARFPAGSSIAAHDTIAVTHQSTSRFLATYGRKPAFAFPYSGDTDASVPSMRPAFPGSIPSAPDSATLTNGGESVVLYYWDGVSSSVTDVDYVVWGVNSGSYVVDKTGIVINGFTYPADTPPGQQQVAATAAHANGNAFRRENYSEGTQRTTGGSGVGGRDETSENLASTWSSNNPAVPPVVKTSGPAALQARAGGPYAGTAGTAINFNGAGSTPATGGTITGYNWSFGDGNTASGAVASHTYTAAGTYTVVLTVAGTGGATDADTTSAVITTGGGGDGAAKKLVLQAVCVTPTAGEYMAVYNPNDVSVDLSNYYLTDGTHMASRTIYCYIATGSPYTPAGSPAGIPGGGAFTDFHARFPVGATIAPHDTIAVTHQGAAGFVATYGRKPAFEFGYSATDDAEVPNMRPAFAGAIPSVPDSVTLTNGGETVVLYYWDGATPLVTDVDYVFWGVNSGSYVVDKSGTTIGGQTYKADTSPGSQVPIAAAAHAIGSMFRREDFTEGNQKATGGNGVGGRDETSENLALTWSSTNLAVPPVVKAPAPPPPTDTLRADAGGPYRGSVKQAVNFDGSRSTPPKNGSITAYAWDFGDNTSGSGVTATHAYDKAGTFSVRLICTDNTGHTNTSTTLATIAEATKPLSVPARTFLPTLNELDTIKVDVAVGSKVTVRVFDLEGRMIRVLYDADFSPTARITWDGRDAQLMLAPAGTYVCVLEARDITGKVERHTAPLVVARRLKRN